MDVTEHQARKDQSENGKVGTNRSASRKVVDLATHPHDPGQSPNYHPELHLHGERTEQGRGLLRRELRKKLLRSADAVTYNGPSCKQYLSGFGVPEEQMFHLPYAADDRTVYNGPVERQESRCRDRMLVVGQLSERKGVDRLVEQLSSYCDKNPSRCIEVIFAGDGPLRGVLESKVTPANLKVKLLGNVPADELSVWMLRCGVLLAPTLADEWMLVVNEALHAGVLVIGSVHAQAVTALIQPGINGWIYDPMVSGSIDQSLASYFACDDATMNQMRHHCRDSVAHRNPDWAANGAIEAILHVLNPTRND